MRGETTGLPDFGRRTAILVAHPDDEVIGAGGQFGLFRDAYFAHLTDGAPRDGRDAAAKGFSRREDYAATRSRELAEALACAGIEASRVRTPGIADQEAAFHLVELSRWTAEFLERVRAEVVLTLPYEGGHPDHDAAAFAVRAAVRLLASSGTRAPEVFEMCSYHDRDGAMETFAFLPWAGVPVRTVELPARARALKALMMACFRTQRATLAPFEIAVERFRPAPEYDFARPPHEGTLYYERFPWGIDGAGWRERAAAALRSLAP